MAAQGQITTLIDKIDTLQISINKLDTNLQVHNAEQKTIEALVRKHEVQLNGNDERPGLVAEVKALSRGMSNIERAIWVVAGVLLAAVATGLLGLL